MNINDNDNRSLPPIQLLITNCPTADDKSMRLGWLHGYCLLTYLPVGAGFQLDGKIHIGEPYGENLAMIQDLADALDPAAVLCGYDLTDTISRMGRLPIEANDPQPALDLLAKLRTMLDGQSPIDLAIDDNSQTEVTLQLLRHQLGNDEQAERAVDDLFGIGLIADHDNSNPHHLAADLAETAGAYLLAVGELYLAEELRPNFSEAVEEWQRTVQPRLPPPSLDHGYGGESIIID